MKNKAKNVLIIDEENVISDGLQIFCSKKSTSRMITSEKTVTLTKY